jgi:hypothetical protein
VTCSTDTHDFRSGSGTIDTRHYILWVNWMHHSVKSGKFGRWGWRRPLLSSVPVLHGAIRNISYLNKSRKRIKNILGSLKVCFPLIQFRYIILKKDIGDY